MNPSKTAKLMEMQFALRTWLGPRNHVLHGVEIPSWEGEILRGELMGKNYSGLFFDTQCIYKTYIYKTSWVPPCSIIIFQLKWLFGTVSIGRFFSIFLCNFYSCLSFQHREIWFHIVLSIPNLRFCWQQSDFKLFYLWTNQRPENRVMTNVSVESES